MSFSPPTATTRNTGAATLSLTRHATTTATRSTVGTVTVSAIHVPASASEFHVGVRWSTNQRAMSTSHRSTRPSANGPTSSSPTAVALVQSTSQPTTSGRQARAAGTEPISHGGPVDVAHAPASSPTGPAPAIGGCASAASGYQRAMPERWFRHAVVYCLDVDTYPGLRRRRRRRPARSRSIGSTTSPASASRASG